MNGRSPKTFVPPAGPILSLTLIGLVLLSALIYYRAVKIQRFLEPALALSQPRNEFSESINRIVQKEFGTGPIRGLEVRSSSLIIEKALLFSRDGTLRASAQDVMKRLGRVLLSLLEDKRTRADISLILISAGYPSGRQGPEVAERMKAQRMLGLVQDSLFRAEPELGRAYGTYFAVAARPAPPREGYLALMELRIIPSELLHMEVLQKLEKYAY